MRLEIQPLETRGLGATSAIVAHHPSPALHSSATGRSSSFSAIPRISSPAMPGHLDRIHRMMRGELPAPPVAHLIGFSVVAAAPGRVTCRMETSIEKHANPMGTVHGGILCDIADAAMGLAHASQLAEDESFTTLELKLNF